MDTNSLIIWLKSIRNVIVGGDNPNYSALGSSEGKPSLMDNSDRNNNIEPVSEEVEIGEISPGAKEHSLSNGRSVRTEALQPPDLESTEHIPVSQSDRMPTTEETHLLSEQHPVEAKLPKVASNGHVTDQGALTAPTPCCDIIKYANELRHDLRSSPVKHQIKFGQKVAASKLIQVMIDAVKNRQLLSSLEPFISSTSQNFCISPLVTVCMRNCSITGLSNVEKAETDGYIRCLDNNRFAIDFVIQLVDLRCEANYSLKLGQKWHKRICLRDKSFTLKLDKCLIFLELRVNTHTKSIRVERFHPISQQNVRCKSSPFKINSVNQKFCKLLQAYFKKLFALNVLKLESQTRRYLDRTALLKYEDIFGDTGLQKMLQCFATSSNATCTDASSSTAAPSDTANS